MNSGDNEINYQFLQMQLDSASQTAEQMADLAQNLRRNITQLYASISRLKSGNVQPVSSGTRAGETLVQSLSQMTTASGKSTDQPGKPTFSVWDGDGARMTWPGQPEQRTTSGSEPAAGDPGHILHQDALRLNLPGLAVIHDPGADDSGVKGILDHLNSLEQQLAEEQRRSGVFHQMYEEAEKERDELQISLQAAERRAEQAEIAKNGALESLHQAYQDTNKALDKLEQAEAERDEWSRQFKVLGRCTTSYKQALQEIAGLEWHHTSAGIARRALAELDTE